MIVLASCATFPSFVQQQCQVAMKDVCQSPSLDALRQINYC